MLNVENLQSLICKKYSHEFLNARAYRVYNYIYTADFTFMNSFGRKCDMKHLNIFTKKHTIISPKILEQKQPSHLNIKVFFRNSPYIESYRKKQSWYP